MKIKADIITLFPDLIEPHLQRLPFSKATDLGLVNYRIWDLKKYSINKYGSVDDKPFGGGVGMIIGIEPIHRCLVDIAQEYGLSELKQALTDEILNAKRIKEALTKASIEVILTKAGGTTYTQSTAKVLGGKGHLVILCGRYEGIDARVEELFCSQAYSIGNYVLSGGELPALVMLESVTRLLEGVLEKPEAALSESYTEGNQVEHPQYTRPAEYKGHKVPDILLSGDHKKIEEWKTKATLVKE